MLSAYRAIFRHRHFAQFWVGFTVSVFGNAMTQAALTWHVYEQTGSATAVGGILVAMTGPIIVGGLLAGWLLDRFDRRWVLVGDCLIRGLAVASVPLAQSLGVLTLGQLYVVAAINGLLLMLALAGSPALVPTLVPAERLTTANALEMLSYTVAGVIGPPLASLLIIAVGAPLVLAVDALTYGLFALALRNLPAAAGRPQAAADQRATGLGWVEVGRLVIGHPVLLATTLMFLIFNVGGTGMLAVWLPLLADRSLGGGVGLYGGLLAALAGGEVLGTLLAGGLRWRLSRVALICLAQTLAGLPLLLIAFQPTALLATIGLALFGLLSAPLTIWAQTERMQIIPAHLRGRTFALLRMLMQSGTPLGGLLAGSLIPLVGLSTIITLSLLLISLPGLLGWQFGRLRDHGQGHSVG